MPRNTLDDLVNHLFAEMERLGVESMTPEQMRDEIERSRALSGVAQRVIETANVTLRAMEFKDAALDANAEMPPLLGGGR